MILTTLAVLLVGIWLALTSQTHVSTTGTLIFGVVVGVLALVDLLRPYAHRPPP